MDKGVKVPIEREKDEVKIQVEKNKEKDKFPAGNDEEEAKGVKKFRSSTKAKGNVYAKGNVLTSDRKHKGLENLKKNV